MYVCVCVYVMSIDTLRAPTTTFAVHLLSCTPNVVYI